MGRRVSKRKWSNDAFVIPPYPLGVNPYLEYAPVFGSRMQMSAATGAGADDDDTYTKRCDSLDRRCDDPNDTNEGKESDEDSDDEFLKSLSEEQRAAFDHKVLFVFFFQSLLIYV